MKNIKKVGDDVSLHWRLSYQNPITNIINSPLCHWNTSTYNIAFNNILLAADLVIRHKANPQTNSKTVYNGSFKIHGNRLPCIHRCTALSQSNAMMFQNYTNNQVRNTLIPVPAYKNKLWSFFLAYTKIWNGFPRYFRTVTWTTQKACKHILIDLHSLTSSVVSTFFTSPPSQGWMFYSFLSFCDVILFFFYVPQSRSDFVLQSRNMQ